jgi:hypothetical protein
MDQPDYEFGEFALQPGSTVHEALDAAGFDCHLPEQGAPAQDDRDGGF